MKSIQKSLKIDDKGRLKLPSEYSGNCFKLNFDLTNSTVTLDILSCQHHHQQWHN